MAISNGVVELSKEVVDLGSNDGGKVADNASNEVCVTQLTDVCKNGIGASPCSVVVDVYARRP